MQEIQQAKVHTLSLNMRENLILSGVVDVSAFDEQAVSVETCVGNLIVKGDNLHISMLSLDTGEVSIDGRISSMQYLGDAQSKGFMSKLFK